MYTYLVFYVFYFLIFCIFCLSAVKCLSMRLHALKLNISDIKMTFTRQLLIHELIRCFPTKFFYCQRLCNLSCHSVANEKAFSNMDQPITKGTYNA